MFEAILSGHIEWHEEFVEVSPGAHDFIQSLMSPDPAQRLGANGVNEVKNHPFFSDISWDSVTTSEAVFVPQVTDVESAATDYFDPHGAVLQVFNDEEPPSLSAGAIHKTGIVPSTLDAPVTTSAPIPVPFMSNREDVSSPPDEFGMFGFENLSQSMKKPPGNLVTSSIDTFRRPLTNPPSPAISVSSIASSPSRMDYIEESGSQVCKPSELGAVERSKLGPGVQGTAICCALMPFADTWG